MIILGNISVSQVLLNCSHLLFPDLKNLHFKMTDGEWKNGMFGCFDNIGNCKLKWWFHKVIWQNFLNYFRLLCVLLLPLRGLQRCRGFEQEWGSLWLFSLFIPLHSHFSFTWWNTWKIWHRGKNVWKSPKMSHLSFPIVAFSTNFCPFKIDLYGNTVWQKVL